MSSRADILRERLAPEVISLIRAISLPKMQLRVGMLGLSKEDADRLVASAIALDPILWDEAGTDGHDLEDVTRAAAEIGGKVAASRNEGNVIVWWTMWVLSRFRELSEEGRGPLLKSPAMSSLDGLLGNWLQQDSELDREFHVADDPQDNDQELRALALWEAIRWRRFVDFWLQLVAALDKQELLAFTAWAQEEFAKHNDGRLLPLPRLER